MNWKVSLVAASVCAVAFTAHGQPVTRFVTGSSPGAGVDNVARLIAEPMSALLDKTIIVENRPGAAYNIAAEYVARSPADGSTVLITFNVHPVAGVLNPGLSFDPVEDFRAVGMIAATPYAIVANPAVPGADLKEMITLVKEQGREPTFGSLGLGTPQHLMMERLKGQTGVDIRMVHYKSATQAMVDAIAGHIDFSLLTIAMAEAQVKSGKLNVLAVTSAERLPQFPDAPTIAEIGYKDFVTDGWYAMLLPAGASPSIVQTYNDALNKALETPAVREKLLGMGATATPGTPDVLDQRLREDAAMWREVVAANGIKPEN